MNKLSYTILNYLMENAKYTVKELASMTGAEESEVASIIEELEKDGTILKYSAVIDWGKVEEETVDAIITVKVKPQKLKGFDAFAEELSSFSEVQSLYLISGGFDLAVFVKARSLGEVARFVSEKLSVVDGIVACDTHFILKKYKVEGQTTYKIGGNERVMML